MLEISGVGIFTAFAAGLISFLSPCVLPLVPGYVSYIAGSTAAERDRSVTPGTAKILVLGICFVMGFSTIFVALGASAAGLSRILLAYRTETNVIGGVIVIFFGILTTGVVRVSWLQNDFRFHSRASGGRRFSAYLLGLAFGFGWTPCIGPVLGAILTVSAVSATISDGILLLGLYSLGLGVPFLLSAVFTSRAAGALKRMRRTGRLLQIAAGGIMVAMGIAMITGTLSNFSFWLLQQFPVFARVG